MKTAEQRTARGRPLKSDAWTTLYSDELHILQATALAKLAWLVHGFSTRVGGASRLDGQAVFNLGHTDWDTRASVLANRAKLLEAVGAGDMKLVTLRQIHSDVIHALDLLPESTPRGDAVMTRLSGLLLSVQIADCVPVLLVDTERRAVAAVHAGWRGTLRRIAAKAVGQMRAAFDTRPENIVAVLGPAIGRCCYEVGPEVAQAYASQFALAHEWFDGLFGQLATGEDPTPLKFLTMVPPGHDPRLPRVRLDLFAANRWQLLGAGVKASNIIASELCTACSTELLFSYRKEGARTGRLMAVIGVRKS